MKDETIYNYKENTFKMENDEKMQKKMMRKSTRTK